MQQILQLNMKFSIPGPNLEAAWLDAAPYIAQVPSLIWKVWLMNEAEHEAVRKRCPQFTCRSSSSSGVMRFSAAATMNTHRPAASSSMVRVPCKLERAGHEHHIVVR